MLHDVLAIHMSSNYRCGMHALRLHRSYWCRACPEGCVGDERSCTALSQKVSTRYHLSEPCLAQLFEILAQLPIDRIGRLVGRSNLCI